MYADSRFVGSDPPLVFRKRTTPPSGIVTSTHFSQMTGGVRWLRRMACESWRSPMESESPWPEMPMYVGSRFAALAPEVPDGMRPCTELNPCEPLMKYAVVLDEQPMPLIFAALCGGNASSQHACINAAVTESCPHPAQRVDIAPS